MWSSVTVDGVGVEDFVSQVLHGSVVFGGVVDFVGVVGVGVVHAGGVLDDGDLVGVQRDLTLECFQGPLQVLIHQMGASVLVECHAGRR